MDPPTPADAAAALADLDDADRAVRRIERRGRPAMLAVGSVLVALDYAAKDLLPARSTRRTVSATCVLLSFLAGVYATARNPVQPVSVDPDDLGPRAAAPGMAVAAGWFVAERVLVVGIRRSRIRRPNTLIGVILAATRPLMFFGVQRLLPRPGHRG